MTSPATNGNGHSVAANGHRKAKRRTAQSPASKVTADPPAIPDDQALVDRCRAGENAAWVEIHTKCHVHLVKQIRYTLGEQSRDVNLVEEIAARVWYGLIADDGYLLSRFEPVKGNGLEKYLSAIARFEALRHQRGEFRRRRRERDTQAFRQSTRDDRGTAEMAMDVQEFLPQLTRREKQFFDCVLLGNDGQEMTVSAPNAWQLRHRIRRKLLAFLELE